MHLYTYIHVKPISKLHMIIFFVHWFAGLFFGSLEEIKNNSKNNNGFCSEITYLGKKKN